MNGGIVTDKAVTSTLGSNKEAEECFLKRAEKKAMNQGSRKTKKVILHTLPREG